MLGVAYMYQTGRGGEPDPVRAADWYERAAGAECPRAEWELAKMYRTEDLPDDQIRSQYLMWLRKAAEHGIPEAMRDLSSAYLYGRIVHKDDRTALQWIRRAADTGDPLSEFRYAASLEAGIGCEKDPDTAKEYYHRFETAADADLFLRVGKDLEFGLEGCPPMPERACHYYRLGARMGHDRCYVSLKRCMAGLSGGHKDTFMERRRYLMMTPTAQEEDRRRLALKEAYALMDAGEEEVGVARFEEAADLGDPEAMFALAMLYHRGGPVRRDEALANDYLLRAALGGSPDAQLFLGRTYESGKGGAADRDEAIRWFAAAAAGGNLLGYYYLSAYMDHPEQYVQKTQRVVRRWG
ncbi:MAG: tetratricopeptide repeat protein [Methanomethylophilus sp.]|jgi:TPR repeat protein